MFNHRHHHWAAVVSRGWAKASACRLQVCLSCAVLCQIVSLQYLSRSSLHHFAGLPCRMVLTRKFHRSYGCYTDLARAKVTRNIFSSAKSVALIDAALLLSQRIGDCTIELAISRWPTVSYVLSLGLSKSDLNGVVTVPSRWP